jgi:hypothetical protein
LIYTNYKGDDVDLRGGDDDADVEDDEDTSPHAKGVSVVMTVLIYPRWWHITA